MTVTARLAGAAMVLSLIPACAPETNTPASEPAVSVPSEAPSGAEAAFAQYLAEPASAEGWRALCRAAAKGHAAAQFAVGVRYRDGLTPVARNLPRAFVWFAAAENGGLTAATLAREAVEKELPDDAVDALRKRPGPPAEADCRVGKISSIKNSGPVTGVTAERRKLARMDDVK